MVILNDHWVKSYSCALGDEVDGIITFYIYLIIIQLIIEVRVEH